MFKTSLACLMLLILAASTGHAETIYKIYDDSGRVIGFTDQPPREGERGEVYEPSGGSSFTPPPAVTPSGSQASWTMAADTDAEEEPAAGYDVLRVVSPANDEAVRSNGGDVVVVGELAPALQPGHALEVYLDGQLRRTASDTSITLVNVDRGTHSLELRVVDETGSTLITSPPSVFHLLRRSVILQP